MKDNNCPFCGSGSRMTKGTHRSIYEVWQCRRCRLKFSHFGEKKEWVPAVFETGKTYVARIRSGSAILKVFLEIKDKAESSAEARVDGLFRKTFELSVVNRVEVLRIGADLVGTPYLLFPYDAREELEA